MQQRPVKFGAQLPYLRPARIAQPSPLRRSSTYLAKIAVVLQEAPDKMLTFTRLMDRLETFSEDRKSAENNIRVCLSTNKCFVKVPLIPGSKDCKRNYWKFDSSQITAKMVRRHFKGILELFPELASRLEAEKASGGPQQRAALRQPPEDVRIRCEVKFIGPFSIDSLLRRDSPSALVSTASPPPSLLQPWPACRGAATSRSFSLGPPPEPLLLQDSAAAQSSAHYGFAAGAADPSFFVYRRVCSAPYFTTSHSGYITYSAPTTSHDYHRFWQ